MRNTGSRDPRESLEASAISPCSIAVNTFSIRFGSLRNQRPVHQKILSITTVSPMMETMRIGHMIGPPLRKLSIKKLPLSAVCGAAEVAAGDPVVAGDSVAVTVDPGAGERPAAGDIPGARAGDMPAAGGGIGAPGCPGTAGLGWPGPAGGGGFPGAVGTFAFGGGGGGGGACRC